MVEDEDFSTEMKAELDANYERIERVNKQTRNK